jgi:hypothetical protein|nr:MAG TPA: hypothetical protein [Caudoviricetes sp.]
MRFLVAEKLGPHKFKTPEGYLICTDAILSRTGKQEYKRCEIFGDSCDDPDKVVNVDRTDEEVFSDKAMTSFENKPVCIEHPDVDVNAENHNELAVGFVRDVHKGEYKGSPVMMGTLVITDKDAVEAIENKEYEELSCGYDCDIEDDGNPCQRNIRGNHVALCKQGRAGIAHIVDSELTNDVPVGRQIATQNRKILMFRNTDKFNDLKNEVNKLQNKSLSSSERNTIENRVKRIVQELKEDYNADMSDVKNNKVDATEQAVKAHYRKANAYIIQSGLNISKICDEEEVKNMKDIQKTSTSGTDKIIYVMQSDIDENLYFYIGKTFSMKEGTWGYTKFEMGNTTPEQLKAELTKNGWHRVVKGPAKIIDASNEELGDDDWSSVKEENYKKANTPIGVKDEEYVQLSRGRFKVVTKTKEELKNEGYGYHHSDRGYSVYVKNNQAVAIKDSVKEKFFTIEYEQDGTMYIRKVRASSIEDAISKVKDDGHKVVIFTKQVLSEMGKNNSIGKYDRVIQAMRSLYSESLLPDNKLKELIRKKVPEYIKKYVKE